ncbi:hypothetical protein F2Q70_00040288 [Brassica cretica]|uniref:Uncharacterized protein n=1 Tax=Brassica cretica TaxID=69181 RepID=A0A8S9MUL3_BRACR|nr:hypothetical protein F2Q70_00040288 [Brassica cretica]KAF2620743.1 hypothetical protein F2Q68_00040973 [Brassica cretica]
MSKMRLLERLIAKEEPLADYEEALKKQLIIEMDASRSWRIVKCGRVTDLCTVEESWT